MSLHVERQGSGSDLVLLHGWGLDSRVWQRVLPSLAKRFTVHAVDLPGYGGSRSVPVRGFYDAVGLLGEALPEGALVCGWSLGAQLAIALALHAPRRVRALALVAATPCFVRRAGWECAMSGETVDAFAEGLARDADATLARFARLATLNGMHGRETRRDLDGMLRDSRPAATDTLLATLAWLRANDLRREVARLAVPTVAIHGEADAVTSPAAGRWLAERIQHARFVALPACAHVPFTSHAAQFVSAIESIDA